jgi:hypothetical protein
MNTVAPGFMPTLSLKALGMTICPFNPTLPVAEVPNGDHVMLCTS